MKIVATQPTILKSSPVQFTDLPESEKIEVAAGWEAPIDAYAHESGHFRFTLGRNEEGDRISLIPSSGGTARNTFFIFAGHARVEGNDRKVIAGFAGASESIKPIYTPGNIDWFNMNAKVSKYFSVKEVTNGDRRRIPVKGSQIEKNILAMALELDKVREDWGSPIGCTSWFRPEPINSQVGGVPGSSHTQGIAVDIYDMMGRDRRFEEWLDRHWGGALGYGVAAGRGFTHLDLRDGKWKQGNGSIRWNY